MSLVGGAHALRRVICDYVLDVHIPNVLIGIGASIEVPLVTILGRRLELSKSEIANFVLLCSLCRTALDIPFSFLLEYTGVRTTMLLSLIINTAAAVGGRFIVSNATLALFCVLSGMSLGAFFLSRHIFVARISSRHNRGTLMALLSGMFRWSHVIGPTASGVIATLTGDIRNTCVLAAAASLLAAFSILVAPLIRHGLQQATSLTSMPPSSVAAGQWDGASGAEPDKHGSHTRDTAHGTVCEDHDVRVVDDAGKDGDAADAANAAAAAAAAASPHGPNSVEDGRLRHRDGRREKNTNSNNKKKTKNGNSRSNSNTDGDLTLQDQSSHVARRPATHGMSPIDGTIASSSKAIDKDTARNSAGGEEGIPNRRNSLDDKEADGRHTNHHHRTTASPARVAPAPSTALPLVDLIVTDVSIESPRQHAAAAAAAADADAVSSCRIDTTTPGAQVVNFHTSLLSLPPGLAVPDTAPPPRATLHALFRTVVDSWSLIWRLGLFVIFFSALRANRKLMIMFAGMQHGMSDAALSYMLSFSFCFDALLFPLGGLVMSWLPRRADAVLPVTVGLASVFAVLPYGRSVQSVYVLSAAFGVVDSLGCGVVMTLIANRAPVQHGGPFFGVVRTLEDVGHVVGAGGVSYLLHRVGFRWCCWMLAAGGGVVAWWAVVGIPDEEQEQEEPSRARHRQRAKSGQAHQVDMHAAEKEVGRVAAADRPLGWWGRVGGREKTDAVKAEEPGALSTAVERGRLGYGTMR